MIFASFLVFMLVHGGVVRGRLYPISVYNDVAQLDDDPDYFVEPLEGNLLDEAFLASYQSDPADDEEIVWMKENIVDRYGFVKDPKMDGWSKQPNFKGDIGTPEFVSAANRVKSFFKKHSDWDTTKKNPAFRSKESCLKLLYITAARYLLVTHILYTESGGKVVICERNADGKVEIPDSVCFSEPYGGASCTSDYDVSLVGKDAGFVTEKFNNYFQSAAGFGKPSEIVFDTNVYAFTLEYAMPYLFAKLPASFPGGVEHKEQTTYYKMQELASAYFKVFKYNERFFQTMEDGAKQAMKYAMKSKGDLEAWLDTFKEMNAEVPMKMGGVLNTREAFRSAHNMEYAKYVKGMSEEGGYKPDLLGDLAKALLYAAEALHTRGGIRHIVGVTQMKTVSTESLSIEDLWVSMIENWGEANKEYHHCEESPLEVCLLKSSKYMWRMFNAMRLIWERLPVKERVGLVQFRGKGFSNPEYAAKVWMGYRKQAKTEIPKERGHVKQFFKQFGCKSVAFGERFSPDCISKMNDKVNAYNLKLASLVTDEPGKPDAGECKNFSPKCGSTYTKSMCLTKRDLMEKNCPHMCNLCQYPLQCKNGGQVDRKTCTCMCYGKWKGADCSEKICDQGWYGENCEKRCFDKVGTDTCKWRVQNGHPCSVGYMKLDCIKTCVCDLLPKPKPKPTIPPRVTAKPVPTHATPSTGEVCKDEYHSPEKCQGWVNNGLCKKDSQYFTWMRENCMKSCGVCTCQDVHDTASCKQWAKIEECKKNPVWMEMNCPRSCLVCDCHDKNSNCGEFVKNGYCVNKYAVWMKENCQKSCNKCS